MRPEYVEKILSLDLELMDIGELIEYLCFLHHPQDFLDSEVESLFKKKYFEVVQFMIFKYGSLDAKDVE